MSAPTAGAARTLFDAAERRHWDEHGFVLVRGALSEAEVSRVRMCALDLVDGRAAMNLGQAGNASDTCVLNAASALPELAELVDHPSVFARVLGLMGPYIAVTGSELLVRLPSDEALHPFHTDGGPSLARVFPSRDSVVLTLKVQFFLTDASAPGHGNMLVVPGSHVLPFPERHEDFRDIGRRSVPILVEAGDAVIFPWSLWHGADYHTGEEPRVSAVLRYSQLWSRPVDHERPARKSLEPLTPRRRRLLGDLGEDGQPGDFYRPATGEHLDLILGEEWADARESRRWLAWESFAHDVYSIDGEDAG